MGILPQDPRIRVSRYTKIRMGDMNQVYFNNYIVGDESFGSGGFDPDYIYKDKGVSRIDAYP